jgi:TonB-dependent SusC/RagA subfamily outer membrane receptor
MKFLISTTIATIGLITSSVLAQTNNIIKTQAHIQSATVYKSGATLTHKTNVQIPKGNYEVVISNVANTLDDNSIQIQAPSQMTILSYTFTRTYKDDKSKIKTPNSDLDKAKRDLDRIANKITSEEKTLALLEANQKIGGDNTGINVAELTKMVTFYKQQQLAIRDTLSSLRTQYTLQQELIKELETETGIINTTPKQEGGYIVLQVQAQSPISSDINISYFTPNAYWTPSYDFKVKSTSQPIQIAYKGDVVQYTGVDWKQTKLELSTYNPTLDNNAPEPYAWFLTYGNPYAKNQKAKSISNDMLLKEEDSLATGRTDGQLGASPQVRIRGFSSISGNSQPLYVVDGAVYTGDINKINPADILSMEVLKDVSSTSMYGSRGANGAVLITTKGKGMSEYTYMEPQEINTAFNISLPYDIMSNNKPHSVLLKEFNHPAHYAHYAVPKLDKDAYLIAHLTNYQELQLMPGNANIIFNNTYVGKTYINPMVVEDTLKVSVGRDKNIVIERTPIVDKKNTKVLSGKKTQTFTYDIKVRNTKNETAQIKLEEMYPIATESGMEVELVESSKASVNKERALLTWDLQLAPNETKTLRISYKVQYPSNKQLGNL